MPTISRTHTTLVTSVLLASLLLPAAVVGQQPDSQGPAPEWLRSLEELLAIEVTSAARKEQRLTDTSSAVYVLTRDQIRRSGARTVPELLRLVPGVQVAQIDASKWAVSIRGFNHRFATKLLVMVDGRSVYTRMFSGVVWDTLPVPVGEIERIEVVRGPGASMWGSNAVNGVVNIITRRPSAPRGGAIEAASGSHDPFATSGWITSPVGGHAAVRLFGEAFQRQGFADAPGSATDDWNRATGGVRVDHDHVAGGSLSLQALASRTRAGQRVWDVEDFASARSGYAPDELTSEAASVSGQWVRPAGRGTSWNVQASADRTHHIERTFETTVTTVNLELQHRLARRGPHDVIWGAAYRRTADDTRGTWTLHMAPPSSVDNLVSVFAQDDISLASDRLMISGGLRVERAPGEGLGLQPTVRTIWRFAPNHAVWAAVSQARRTPSRSDRGLRYNVVVPTADQVLVLSWFGSPDIVSENLVAAELGWRRWFGSRVSIDLTGFRHRYTRLHSWEPGAPSFEFLPAPPHVVVPLTAANLAEADSHGVELAGVATLHSRIRLTASYVYLSITVDPAEGGRDASLDGLAAAPRHQWQLWSAFTLPYRIELDATLARTGRFPSGEVSGYTRLDGRVALPLGAHFELSVTGRNLLANGKQEFTDLYDTVKGMPVGRSGRVGLLWRF